MPIAPAAPCSEPRCPNRKPCAVHRQTTSQRGYGTDHQRERAVALPGARCARCGSTENLQRNHRIPLSMGGTNDPSNLEWLCGPCHGQTGIRRSSRIERVVPWSVPGWRHGR